MSAILDLAGGTHTITSSSTETYYKITNSVAGGHLIMAAGSTLKFDDEAFSGFDPDALSYDMTINGNAASECTLESVSANPSHRWALPPTTITMLATETQFKGCSGSTTSANWTLNYVTFTSGMYCTPANVASQLRLKTDGTSTRKVFSSSTDPTDTEITEWIDEASQYIDETTHHAWRETTVSNEYHAYKGQYDGLWKDVRIPLNHRSVRTFSHALGDKLEYFNFTTYVDMLADTDYVEGEGNDYFVDYTNGHIVFVGTKPRIYPQAVRVTYRYGESSVPYDIREACTKLVAIRYLESELYTATVPNGPGLSPSKDSIIDKWQADVDKILNRRSEMPVMNL